MTADPALSTALDTLRRRRAALDDAIRALERVVAGTDSAPLDVSSAPKKRTGLAEVAKRRGAGMEAVLTLLRERPGRKFTPEELAEAFAARGVELRSENPPRAARAAANRARERDPDIKLEDGRFVYRPGSSEPELEQLAVSSAEGAGFQPR